MPSFSTNATEQKNASGSSWSSGKARQGVYASTRYEGAIKFNGLGDLAMSNIAISKIQLRVTFGPAGGSSTKYLTMYKSTSNTISGSIGSMRGASIGAIAVSNAYNRTVTLTFSDSENSGMFSAMRSHFLAGNRVLIIYVPTTRGTYSGGYCYDYLTVTAATLIISYEYLQSIGSLQSTSVAAGNTAQLNISAYNASYTHKVTWQFGSYLNVQSIPAGTSSASYTIPPTWQNAIPSATSGTASVSLQTLDSGGNSLGSNSYNFTITAPSSVRPSISSVSVSPINSNATIAGWGLYVFGKSQAKMTVNGATGAYGSTISSYSIETSPSIGSANASTLTTGILYKSGTVTVTARVTDSRGRTATATCTLYIHSYTSPYFTENIAYRCTSNGTRDDSNGTYAYVKASFTCYTLNGSNGVTASMTLKQVGGSTIATGSLVSGTGYILGNGSLVSDATYQVLITLTDTVGSITTYTGEINSAAYIMHIKKGGKAVGFGMAAGDDETVSFGWQIKLSTPLGIAQGGTGASTAANACAVLGAVKKTGDTLSGNLSIATSLYPSQLLLPSYNSTTNRTVFEGSYVGASSFAAWEDNTGNNRRMLEVRTKQYASSNDNAVVLRTCENGTWASYRLFHTGMSTPVPITKGGTGASSGKAALQSLGIFYASSLPSSGVDGQICLVPV